MSSDGVGNCTIRAVDLFCGAGGTLEGLAQYCDDAGHDLEVTAVNHWETAIETHRKNHPNGNHHISKVEELHPPDVVDGNEIHVLIASPECTHFSIARGGKPVSEQKRASPWHVLDWVEKLRPEHVLLENVPELESWGPIDEDGQPTRNGETFDAWINAFHALGYSLDWTTLNAADYGDATSRKRLFVVGRRGQRAEFPDPTHSKDGAGDTEKWRPASEVIDWSDPGESIWQRSRPLVNNTMRRIAEGIRRHCDDELKPLADAIAELTADDVEEMQQHVVEMDEAPEVVEDRCEPFLLRQQSGGVPASTSTPVPTVATRGAISKVESYAFVLPRNGAFRGIHSNPAYDPDDRPLHTVTAKNSDGHLVTPYLIQYNGNSDATPIGDPLPTVTTRDRFALVVPDLLPYGIDIRYRMLQPRELAAAMGFPDDYEFAGNKTETTKQIGNAVPVNLAKALCKKLLTGNEPSLQTYHEVPADD